MCCGVVSADVFCEAMSGYSVLLYRAPRTEGGCDYATLNATTVWRCESGLNELNWGKLRNGEGRA